MEVISGARAACCEGLARAQPLAGSVHQEAVWCESFYFIQFAEPRGEVFNNAAAGSEVCAWAHVLGGTGEWG